MEKNSGPPKSDYKPGDIILEPNEDVEFVTYQSYGKIPKQQFVSKSIQTDYRESEAQTDPWDPPYNVTKVYKDPEVFSISKLSYGNGLPAGLLEVKYILETREHKNELGTRNTDEEFVKHKQIMCKQVQSDWNYRLAVENKKLCDKLTHLESAVIQDFQKYTDRKETCLKNMWMHRKHEMSKKKFKLEKKLHRELMALESDCQNLRKIQSDVQNNSFDHDITIALKNRRGSLTEDMDHVLSNNYSSSPNGVSTVKSWLEKKADGLTTKVPLIKKTKRTTREKMAEKAYQNILDKKRAKLPLHIYREDFVEEKLPTPLVKTENVLEVFDFVEEKIDMVTVLQQALCGFAYQRQMLELIKRHEDGLSTILPLNN